MIDSIHIKLAESSRQADLVDFLNECGLSPCAVFENGWTDLEVSYAEDEADRLRADCWAALQLWLSERELPFVATSVSADGFVLRPPSE